MTERIIVFILSFTLLFTNGSLHAQNISGIINSYARVASITGTTLTINNLSGSIADFEPGDKVLLIQMKGADINRSNTSDYGSFVDLKEAGNYEYAIVDNITGAGPNYIISLHHLSRPFDVNGDVQIVSVPQYDDVIVTGNISALPWNRLLGTGGVLVLEASGTITLAADIDVSGRGFAGGSESPTQNGNGTDVATFVTTSTILGQKGEGIAAYGAEGWYGMGALANGGGGGNTHNAGGGGGGNQSAGGLGGDSHYGPGGNGNPGKQILITPADNKIFMGGGGGGGQQNNHNASPGGAGGGIIIVRAQKIVSDCAVPRSIAANGAHAANTTGNDGGGGGGAGGTILLEVGAFELSCDINISTHGGNGGTVQSSQRHAGGGGGGAGAILLPLAPASLHTHVSSHSGDPGMDCNAATCSSSGSTGAPCAGNACDGDESWPLLPNTAPIAYDDLVSTAKGASATIAVLVNDKDADFGSVFTISTVSAPGKGTVALSGNNFIYTPSPGFIGSDSFEYQICDNGSPVLCSTATVTILVEGIALSNMESTPLQFTEGQLPLKITELTINQSGGTTLTGLDIEISNNYISSEDLLAFTDVYGISGSWDAALGTLSLSGSASFADYEMALHAVTYLNTNNNNPSNQTRTISFTAKDGVTTSNTLSRSVQIIPVNDAPALAAIEISALTFTEGDAAKTITASIATSDVDNANLSGATVSITANYLASEDQLSFTNASGISGNWDAATGTLTLSGIASLAHYQVALRSISYQNTNNDNPSAATRTVSFTISDGSLNSNTATREIKVIPVNDAPALAAVETSALTFTEGDAAKAITASIATSDVDHANLSGASVAITANYLASEDQLSFTNANGISGNWDAATGILTLSGTASLAHYQAALRNISYQNTNNNNPSAATRTVSFTISDGSLSSNTATREIKVIPVNDAPTLAAVETSALEFTEGDAAKAITASIATSDVDHANLSGASVAITANYLASEDQLSFTNANGISGNWDAATGILTLSGTASLAHYQAALRSISYQNTNNDNPSAATRTVSFTISDGSLSSNTATRNIKITPVNDAPELSAIESVALQFTEGDPATFITVQLESKDVDNTTLSGAKVEISSNYLATEDILSATASDGIIASWDSETATLTLSGTASLADYQAALRTVTYQNTNNEKPSELTRTVSFTVDDGSLQSNVLSREIIIIPVNDPPVTAPDVATTDKNVAVGINVLQNDLDVEGDDLRVSAETEIPPSHGTLVLNADQTFTYTPEFNFFGSDTFVYKVCDDGSPEECTTAIVNISINYKNYPPVALDDIVETKEDEALIIEVLANDSDPDLDDIIVSPNLIAKPKFGKLVLADNKYTYTPNLNYNGNDAFQYEICDNGTPSICVTATVDIYVEPVNDAPEPANDFYENKDVIAEINGNVLENDYDIEADRLFVSLDKLVQPRNGQITMRENGDFSYLPNPGFFGEDVFEYFACDDGDPSLCTKAMVSLLVSSGVPKGFSPNGDNTNDEWIITGLEEFPMNKVVVLNRYGDTVFEIDGYDNASRVWRGESNKGLKMGGSNLPDGTYFYVIDFGDGKSMEKGFIIVKR